MALFTGVQHLCTFNIVTTYLSPLPNVWKASYTISASILVDVPYWPPYSTAKFLSCVVPGPSQWFFHFGEEIVIAWTHIGWVQWMFQNLSLPAVQEFPWQQQWCDSLHCHEEWWGYVSPSVVVFSECWTMVLLQEHAVVGSIYHLPWRYSMVQY